MATTWNGDLPLLNRLLWANIESVPKKSFGTLVTRYTASDYLLRAEKQKLIRVFELIPKRRKPIDLKRRIMELGQKTMHNSFHHEALGFAREVKDKALEAFFTSRLAQIEEQMDTNRIAP